MVDYHVQQRRGSASRFHRSWQHRHPQQRRDVVGQRGSGEVEPAVILLDGKADRLVLFEFHQSHRESPRNRTVMFAQDRQPYRSLLCP